MYIDLGENMSRNTRQAQILNIVAKKDVETQEELLAELKLAGFAVTQATISRDIKELSLVKAATHKGGYKYVVSTFADSTISTKRMSLLKESVVSIVAANNLIVVKTLLSSAAMVSEIISQLAFEGVLGVVGNGDTILIVTIDAATADEVAEKLRKMVF
jgi:transcriptional regulator of arginine metabolism